MPVNGATFFKRYLYSVVYVIDLFFNWVCYFMFCFLSEEKKMSLTKYKKLTQEAEKLRRHLSILGSELNSKYSLSACRDAVAIENGYTNWMEVWQEFRK